jgi:hypothetical protein
MFPPEGELLFSVLFMNLFYTFIKKGGGVLNSPNYGFRKFGIGRQNHHSLTTFTGKINTPSRLRRGIFVQEKIN